MSPWMRCGQQSVSARKKVSIVYRRRVADMTALEEEIQGAVAEGVEVKTLMAPSKIEVSEDGNVKGIWVTPQMIAGYKTAELV